MSICGSKYKDSAGRWVLPKGATRWAPPEGCGPGEATASTRCFNGPPAWCTRLSRADRLAAARFQPLRRSAGLGEVDGETVAAAAGDTLRGLGLLVVATGFGVGAGALAGHLYAGDKKTGAVSAAVGIGTALTVAILRG